MIVEELTQLVAQVSGWPAKQIKLEHPADLARGDYACHLASPKGESGKRALELVEKINQNKPAWLEKVEAVGGFVNFFLSPKFFTQSLEEILQKNNNYGENQKLLGRKTIVEYTDPNPFKEFHIGHLMSNTIGESISRLLAAQGLEVKRACYQGDVGLHVAKAIWGLQKMKPAELKNDPKLLGQAYALGATQGDEAEIKEINKKIYERSDEEINKLYDWGREISLKYFEQIYQKLGTKFDFNFFESETGEFGKKIVEDNLGRVFEKSEGAIVFRGDEKEGLHTRVFVNSDGLPTYEAKELGLAKIKFDKYPYDLSIVVTGNEIKAYFQVLLKVMSLIFPELAAKTKHVSHGMLRLPTGKMSSRTGDVVTFESLLTAVNQKILEKTHQEDRGVTREDVEKISIAALKYSILRQSPGKDIIFDFDKSLSFEGDSGPYLQYTCVRAKSVLAKVEKNFLGSSETIPRSLENFSPTMVERLLYRFPEVVERAATDFAPSHLVTYLTELASAFNSYYAANQIIGSPEEKYRVKLTAATAQVLENGLTLLGIKVPEKM